MRDLLKYAKRNWPLIGLWALEEFVLNNEQTATLILFVTIPLFEILRELIDVHRTLRSKEVRHVEPQ